jgi:hypothetical protein
MKTNIYFFIILITFTSCNEKKKQSTFNFKHFVYQNFEKEEKLPPEFKTIRANTFNFNDTLVVNLSKLNLENVKIFKEFSPETSLKLIHYDTINNWESYKDNDFDKQTTNVKLKIKEELILKELSYYQFYFIKKLKNIDSINSYLVLKSHKYDDNGLFRKNILFLINSKNDVIKSIIKFSSYFLYNGEDLYFYSKILDKNTFEYKHVELNYNYSNVGKEFGSRNESYGKYQINDEGFFEPL